MKNLGVYDQITVTNTNNLKKIKGLATLRGRARKLRNHLIEKLKQNHLSSDELSHSESVGFRRKNAISIKIYTVTMLLLGAIHILAVSGLHTGIIYMILLYVLSPIKRLLKNEKGIAVIIVILLWGFAFLTGLSPSVIRAVTMFSFFALAKTINRDTNATNTLFLSYFTLLIINPNWLFHVGFQLSYLAVLFILWLVFQYGIKSITPNILFLKKFGI